MRPLAAGHLRFDTAIAETALLDGVTITDIHTHMAIRAQRNAGDFRQSVDGAPCAALVLGIGEHTVSGLVRAGVAAILAGERVVSADGLDHAHTTACPVIAFDQAHAIGANFLLDNIVFVAAGSAGTIMGRVLLALAREQAVGTLVDDRPVPIGLADHLLAKGNEVLISIRCIDSLTHNDTP